jgi:hypothetical protein
MKKREIVTELQKVCELTRPTLLKLTKSDLIKMYNKFTSSDSEPTAKESVKKPREKKQRLLDFSSDEEEDEEKTDKEVKPIVKPVTKKVKKVKKEPPLAEQEPVIEEPVEEEEEEPVVEEKVKPVKVKAKKVNQIKLEIKELLKSFKDEVSKAILDFKKSDDSDYLIDSYNELRIEAEQEVSEILDENSGKVSDSLLDYVDNLIDCQKRRIERLLD